MAVKAIFVKSLTIVAFLVVVPSIKTVLVITGFVKAKPVVTLPA
jgi:hypothetical protein